MSDFVHLHVHTHYSLLDGATRIVPLIEKTKAMGMDSIAISDHGNLSARSSSTPRRRGPA